LGLHLVDQMFCLRPQNVFKVFRDPPPEDNVIGTILYSSQQADENKDRGSHTLSSSYVTPQTCSCSKDISSLDIFWLISVLRPKTLSSPNRLLTAKGICLVDKPNFSKPSCRRPSSRDSFLPCSSTGRSFMFSLIRSSSHFAVSSFLTASSNLSRSPQKRL